MERCRSRFSKHKSMIHSARRKPDLYHGLQAVNVTPFSRDGAWRLVIREALNAKDPDHGWNLVFFVVALSALWIFRGRQLSLFIDRFEQLKQRQPGSIPSPTKQRDWRDPRVNDLGMSLNDRTPAGASPSSAQPKTINLLWRAVASFPFGPLASAGKMPASSRNCTTDRRRFFHQSPKKRP